MPDEPLAAAEDRDQTTSPATGPTTGPSAGPTMDDRSLTDAELDDIEANLARAEETLSLLADDDADPAAITVWLSDAAEDVPVESRGTPTGTDSHAATQPSVTRS